MRVPQTIKRIVGGAVGVAALVALAIPGTANATPTQITVNTGATADLTIKASSNAQINGHTFKAIRLAAYTNATADGTKLGSVSVASNNAPTGVKTALNAAYTAVGGALPVAYTNNVMGAVASQWLGFPVTTAPNSDPTSNDPDHAYAGKLRDFATKLVAQQGIKDALADIPTNHSERMVTVTSTTATTAKFTAVGTGMYLIVDTTASNGGTVSSLDTPASIPMIVGTELVDNSANHYTEFTGDATDIKLGEVNVKNNTPTIAKQLVSPTAAGEVSIGSIVTYRIVGSVPLTTGFDHYKYVVTDFPGAGLTFNPASVSIDLGLTHDGAVTHTMTSGVDYTVAGPTAPDGHITFNLSPGIRGLSPDYYGQVIRIHYTMTVNNDATSGATSNVSNGIKLNYSNDPSAQPGDDNGNGNLDPNNPATENEIDDNDPGTQVHVYFYGFTLEDVSKNNPNDKLAGAKFNVIDPNTGSPILFLKLGEGNYKRAMSPSDSGATPDLFSSDGTAGGLNAPKGQVKIDGLGADTYQVNEVGVPPSYSDLFKSEFEVTIDATTPTDETYSNTGSTWGLVTAGTWGHADATSHVITVREVTSFTQLPMTGGAGAILIGLVVIVLLGTAGAIYIYTRRGEKSLSQEV
ncbi:isopeptide-forming domain-containing fimbrial protein [Bifidobacterium sp. ESL0728]|uniref:isopeptide-forming domain-containing fimbrial protein n=1 Tax=Bifidobacterium sp. ESL0728 TaxID=2983220 RepID=UPI0023F95BA9|nr:isopeptide-forming domain-containing fimbrial protein [Bifidobacterium sp. ESL0728]WEV58486.1 isopeptide-forming domain-containing fimbrial protein [Bifidobacterium sp. ESL0728]